MQRLGTSLVVLTLLGMGYFAGSVDLLTLEELSAQGAAAPQGPSEDSVVKITSSFDTIKTAAASLKREGRYEPATRGFNLFAVSVGGLDVKGDLEKGRGVDPETFAALYAGLAATEVQEHIDKDSQGRVTYKGKVVQMYPIRRLTQLFKERLKYSGEEMTP
jgi:hypothetical protein|tara:strand:+ start:81 stop:563 length:483 start_codon:yes stop_codon:yes gene_type:complete